MANQPARKTPAKKAAAKKTGAKKAAPKKKAAGAKKAAPKKKADPVKAVYNKVEEIAEENGVNLDAYEDKAIEVIEDVSEKVLNEIAKQRKGLLKKLFAWIKK